MKCTVCHKEMGRNYYRHPYCRQPRCEKHRVPFRAGEWSSVLHFSDDGKAIEFRRYHNGKLVWRSKQYPVAPVEEAGR